MAMSNTSPFFPKSHGLGLARLRPSYDLPHGRKMAELWFQENQGEIEARPFAVATVVFRLVSYPGRSPLPPRRAKFIRCTEQH